MLSQNKCVTLTMGAVHHTDMLTQSTFVTYYARLAYTHFLVTTRRVDKE